MARIILKNPRNDFSNRRGGEGGKYLTPDVLLNIEKMKSYTGFLARFLDGLLFFPSLLLP